MTSQTRTQRDMTLRFSERGSRAHKLTVVLGSLLLHGAAFASLSVSERLPTRMPEPVRVTVSAPAPPAPSEPTPPVAAAEPSAEMASAPVPKSVKKKAKKADAPEAVSKPVEPARESPAEALDFTGVTMTGTGDSGWASVTGNGEASQGPLAAPPRGTRTGTGTSASASDGDAAKGPAVVGLASLSQPPRAPSLDQVLLHNYPQKARDMGLAGRAVVRARILPDGSVDRTQVLVASAPEFGRACQRTLNGSRWSPPLDRQGRPVATDVSYTCQFEVTR